MKTKDFYYDLPEELIAQTPVEPRDASRLMTLDKTTGTIGHYHFRDIVDLLREGDCLILNDSRVLPARIYGVKEDTGRPRGVPAAGKQGERPVGSSGRPWEKGQEGAAGSPLGTGCCAVKWWTCSPTATGSSSSSTRGFSSICWTRSARCPCLPILRKSSRTGERYQTVYSGRWAPPPPPPPGCTLPQNCWSG